MEGNILFIVIGGAAVILSLMLSDFGCTQIKIFPKISPYVRWFMDFMAVIVAIMVWRSTEKSISISIFEWILVAGVYCFIGFIFMKPIIKRMLDDCLNIW